MLVVLAGVAGLLIGLLGPSCVPTMQAIRQAQQAWLDPAATTPLPTTTPTGLNLTRPAVAQTAVPPTLRPASAATAVPLAPPAPTPAVRVFVIPLKGGGEMHVVAGDEAAARNNVKSSGADPAD